MENYFKYSLKYHPCQLIWKLWFRCLVPVFVCKYQQLVHQPCDSAKVESSRMKTSAKFVKTFFADIFKCQQQSRGELLFVFLLNLNFSRNGSVGSNINKRVPFNGPLIVISSCGTSNCFSSHQSHHRLGNLLEIVKKLLRKIWFTIWNG